MSLRHIVVVSTIGVIVGLGVQTSGPSEVEAMRAEVSQLARQVESLAQRMESLSKLVHETTVVSQLEGSVEVEENTCELVDNGGNRMTLIFGEAERRNPIISTEHTLKKPRDFSRIELKGNPETLVISYQFLEQEIVIRERVEEALKHFAPVIPFSHLSDVTLGKLRSYLPVQENDREKCIRIFQLLLKNPPRKFGKGVEWFTEFHYSIFDDGNLPTLIGSWKRR
ncbi:hypothetical protein FOZ63_022891 [Perkinsus olseni]|uniref:Uncharacterized protein n=1 Tax=Perkinsus olseni TaxID=32597 RepID=A0A7J6QJ27_PEROL|nr:hypothetical protein FOZ62_031983 [Perkinsus olseni]KAF4711542.1 hypothetical protein FOZ63_022891 [Perkinsus olseni]